MAEKLSDMSLPDRQAVRRVAELILRNLNLSAAKVDKLQLMPYEQLATAAKQTSSTALTFDT